MTRDQLLSLKKGDKVHYQNGEHSEGEVMSVMPSIYSKLITVRLLMAGRQVLQLKKEETDQLHRAQDCPRRRRSNNFAVQPTLL